MYVAGLSMVGVINAGSDSPQVMRLMWMILIIKVKMHFPLYFLQNAVFLLILEEGSLDTFLNVI